MSDGRAQPPSLFATVFWIRLYGVITDLRDHYKPTSELNEVLVAAGAYFPLVTAAAEIFRACTAIREGLSDDELVFATFVRHVHAHVYQDGFEYSLERGNPSAPALRTKQFVKTARRHISIDEVHAIVDRLMSEHGMDDSAVALTFAERLWPGISRLRDAVDTFDAKSRASVPGGLDQVP